MVRLRLLALCGILVLAELASAQPLAPQPVAPWPESPRATAPNVFYGLASADRVSLEFTPWFSDAGFDGVAAATVGWPMRGNVPANTYATAALGPVWGIRSWKYDPPETPYVWRPTVGPDGTIYVCTTNLTSGVLGKLVALKPDGTVKWSTLLTNSANVNVWTSTSPVLDQDGNLYVAWAHDRDFRSLTCISFDAAGTVRWHFEPNIELEYASHQEPVLANGTLYAALDTSFYIGNPTHRASIFALDPASGKSRWHWRSPNLDTFFDGPAVGPDGAIYHASSSNGLRGADGWLYRIWPDGTLDWSVDIGPGVNNPPAVDENNNSYLGDLVGVAYKFGPDGKMKWSYDTQSGRIYTTTAYHKGRVYVGAAGAGLHVLDAETGGKLAIYGAGYYPMGKSLDRAGNVFFYCFDGPGSVLAFGRDGQLRWQSTTGAGVSVNACIVGADGLLLASSSQSLTAFTGRTVGDLNCDGVVDNFDIDPFVLALTDEPGYKQKYPDCERMLADINGDGVVDNFDIDPFVVLLTP